MKAESRGGAASGSLFAVLFGIAGAAACLCSACRTVDSVSGATSSGKQVSDLHDGLDFEDSKILLVVASPDSNTGKIGRVFAKVLGAHIREARSIDPFELPKYDLIGFGSGIVDQKHHSDLLELVSAMPGLDDTNVFLFSTSGISRKTALENPKMIDDPHTPLRKAVTAKGGIVIAEFNCAGFNDNGFLKLFGGMNKGKPDAKDLRDAESFAENLQSMRIP